MEDMLNIFDNMLENEEVSFKDINDLEDMITPGSGTGCNCPSTD